MFQEADRQICATNILHRADQMCRRLISQAMTSARGKNITIIAHQHVSWSISCVMSLQKIIGHLQMFWRILLRSWMSWRLIFYKSWRRKSFIKCLYAQRSQWTPRNSWWQQREPLSEIHNIVSEHNLNRDFHESFLWTTEAFVLITYSSKHHKLFTRDVL